MRDKEKREATQKSKTIKERAKDVPRKRVDRINSSSFAEPIHRRLTKLNSGQKLQPDAKISIKDVVVKPRANQST